MFGQRHLVALDEKLRDRQMVAGVANHNLGSRLQLHQAGGLAESDRRTSPLTSVSRLFGMGFAHKKLEMPLRSLFLLNEPNDQRLTHEGDFE